MWKIERTQKDCKLIAPNGSDFGKFTLINLSHHTFKDRDKQAQGLKLAVEDKFKVVRVFCDDYFEKGPSDPTARARKVIDYLDMIRGYGLHSIVTLGNVYRGLTGMYEPFKDSIWFDKGFIEDGYLDFVHDFTRMVKGRDDIIMFQLINEGRKYKDAQGYISWCKDIKTQIQKTDPDRLISPGQLAFQLTAYLAEKQRDIKKGEAIAELWLMKYGMDYIHSFSMYNFEGRNSDDFEICKTLNIPCFNFEYGFVSPPYGGMLSHDFEKARFSAKNCLEKFRAICLGAWTPGEKAGYTGGTVETREYWQNLNKYLQENKNAK